MRRAFDKAVRWKLLAFAADGGLWKLNVARAASFLRVSRKLDVSPESDSLDLLRQTVTDRRQRCGRKRVRLNLIKTSVCLASVSGEL